jgi:hypothetical protein
VVVVAVKWSLLELVGCGIVDSDVAIVVERDDEDEDDEDDKNFCSHS